MDRTPANTIKERYLDSLFSNHEWTRMDTNFCKPQITQITQIFTNSLPAGADKTRRLQL